MFQGPCLCKRKADPQTTGGLALYLGRHDRFCCHEHDSGLFTVVQHQKTTGMSDPLYMISCRQLLQGVLRNQHKVALASSTSSGFAGLRTIK